MRALHVLAVAPVACLLLVALAPPAAAHGRASDASNYSSVITQTPEIEGVRWRIYGGDELLSVTNTTGAELTVFGYEQDPEPYLRIGPEGVFENRNSPATYLNEARFGASVPPGVDPAQEPDWVRVGDGPSYAWHDHRIHWMGLQLPPQVAAEPGEAREIYEWAVPFAIDGEAYEVAGSLRWIPGPPVWPWLLVGLVLTAPALLGLRTSPVDGRWPGLSRPAAAVLGAVAAANLVHLVDDVFAVPRPVPEIALSALQTALFIAIGVFGALRAWQGREGAFTALGIGSAAIFLGQGVLYLGALQSSQDASLAPGWFARTVIAASVVQLLPVGAASVIGSRRSASRAPAAAVESEPVAT